MFAFRSPHLQVVRAVRSFLFSGGRSEALSAGARFNFATETKASETKIDASKPTSSKSKFGAATCFVGNIGPNIGEMELIRLLSQCGKVSRFTKIRNKNYGFCLFEDPASVDTAISKFNGFEVGGRVLVVTKREIKSKTAPDHENEK